MIPNEPQRQIRDDVHALAQARFHPATRPAQQKAVRPRCSASFACKAIKRTRKERL
ncbi:hypothetical protein [Novosphingobium sp. SG720]|uniref:hypothetical protein n=1 Tax=Novosphingobium sp. SG720 TaxID=2586998 RepID=UPI001445110D|nr:hypothetical protein [Novosphingobium sp. SG720]NKJ42319.1 hypothetical protein [Novosphingobium sp. SG720]